MYCSLEEAYQVPSFAVGRRKGGCKPRGQSDGPQGPTAFESQAPEQARHSGYEEFTNNIGIRDKRTYKGQASDYEYYGKTYGLKFPKVAEGFEASQGPMGQGAKGQCESPQAQRYEIPISKEAKEAHARAVKAAIDDEGAFTPFPTQKAQKVDMNEVSGYYDEDLENYLSINDMRAAPAQNMPNVSPKQPQAKPAQPYDPDESPFAKAMQQALPVLREARESREARAVDHWQNMWDILLFIIAGLLVIFLCEQLFKLAMMVGMKHALEVLQPYLK